jgi:hypothetical protein
MNTDIDYMREIYAQDTDGNMVSAHVRCTYKCGECEVVKLLAGRHDNLQVDGTPTCTTCIDDLSSRDQIGRCPYCGQYFTHMMYCEQRDRELCESCYDQGWDCDECGYTIYAGDDHECYRDRDSLIYDYSHKPRPEFYGRDDYYFGIELEVEDKCEWGCNSGAEIVLETVGNRMYMKHDGSLDNGFEIVSHPHSLDELKNEVNWGFLTRLKNAGFRSWDTSTCGLHVHVSRTAFRKNGKHDEAHELRFQKLIYDNDKHVSAIAGRETSYARFADKGNLVPKVKHGLEIRVFRGSLKKQRVLSAVEFIHSAVEYTRNMKIDPKTKQLSWVRFMGYVMDNQEKYPNFTQIALSALDNMRVSLSQSRDSEEN